MMKGRDLITYIVENGLEDSPVFEDGKFIGFMSEVEAAIKFEVGVATIRVWINQGLLEGIRINDTIYIPQNSKNPKEINKNEKDTTNFNTGDVSVSDDLCGTEELDSQAKRITPIGY